MRKNGKNVVCDGCGKTVYMPKNRLKTFRFCSRKCHGRTVLGCDESQKRIKRRHGKDHPNYKGGTVNKERGYRLICVNGKQVYEHRYIMEQHLGRRLRKRENVHHINGDKLDNRIENLEVIDVGDHIRECHPKKRVRNYNESKKCLGCGELFYRHEKPLRFNKTKFCSKQCYLKNLNRNYHGYIIKTQPTGQ